MWDRVHPITVQLKCYLQHQSSTQSDTILVTGQGHSHWVNNRLAKETFPSLLWPSQVCFKHKIQIVFVKAAAESQKPLSHTPSPISKQV